MNIFHHQELHPSANSVCIDVDTIYLSEENNNNSYVNKEFDSNNSGFNPNDNLNYKCHINSLLKNPEVKSQTASTTREKRQRYAKYSPRSTKKGTSSLINIAEDREHIQMEPKGSKCSAQFENDPEQDRLGKMYQSNSKELHHLHFVPRKSLLGKPIVVRSYSRQDAQYRKLQSKIYNFLERPKNWNAVGYHIIIFASVFTCLVLSVLSTIDDIGVYAGEMLFYVELSVLFWFFTEYCLRLWSAGCRSRYQTWRGRLLFARQPFCLVDLVVILASIIVLAYGSDRQMFAASALRGLRFFQILRMIRMDRRGGSWKLLASVVWAHRQELFTTIYIGFLVLVFSSFLIYLAEKDDKDKIKSYADALWWGVITLCTVGYGDTVPKTALGKLIAGCCAIAGISFFALPAGILGSGFALKVQQHQRHKHLIRRRMPAATLIQCLWRCYSSDPQSTSVATWKPHLKSFRSSTVEKNTSAVDSSILSSISAVDKLAKFSRISTIKRRCEKLANTIPPGHNLSHSLSSSNIVLNSYNRNNGTNETEPVDEDPEDDDNNNFNLYSTPAFSISRRNALAQSVEKYREEDPASKKKFGILDDFFLNRYTSMASMNREEILTEEWDAFLPKRELTVTEKHAIRFIRKVRFFVASRKFKEALRPYDLKDIIEQYSSGHVDMLARIKGLQQRLDNLFGRSDMKISEGYDSRVSLASRIVKIENKVESIELKLDKFIQLYKQHNINNSNHIQHNVSSSGHFRQFNPEIVPHPSSPLIYHRATCVGFVENHKTPPETMKQSHKFPKISKDLDTIPDISPTSVSNPETMRKKFDEV